MKRLEATCEKNEPEENKLGKLRRRINRAKQEIRIKKKEREV